MEFIASLSNKIIHQIHSFSPFLRRNGFRVGSSESLAAMHALTVIDIESMEQVLYALRSIYASTSAEWSIFPSLFKRHFSVNQHRLQLPQTRVEENESVQGKTMYTDMSSTHQLQGAILPAYSPYLGQQYPLLFFDNQHVGQMIKWTKQAVLQMKRPRSRRLEKGKRPRIDFRNTLRKAMKYGGEPIKIARSQYRLARPRIVIVVDISGSMKEYADLFLTIAWTFMHSPARVEVFVFSTNMKRITPLLANKFLQGIPLEKLVDLKGGTRIGFSLSRLSERYANLLRKKTCLFIISDGFDTGDPQVLRQTMDLLSKKVGQLIWCNPLLGEEEYEPISIGMQTALPFVDRFIDVHDASSWIQAVRLNLFST